MRSSLAGSPEKLCACSRGGGIENRTGWETLQFDQARNKPMPTVQIPNPPPESSDARFLRYPSKPEGMAVAAVARKFRCARFCYNLVSRAYTSSKFARQKIGVSEIRNRWPFSFRYAAQGPAYFSGLNRSLKRARSSGSWL